MSFRHCVIVILSVSISKLASGQTDGDLVIENIIETIADRVAEDFDFAELTERLNYYQKHPLNINKTNADELSGFAFLTPLQINALLTHIELNGNIIELAELQSIDGFDLETIRKLLPFVSTGAYNSLNSIGLSELSKAGRHDLMFRYGSVLESRTGFQIPDTSDKNRYVGSPFKMLVRYRYNYGRNLSAAINLDKDAGEPFVKGRKFSGFDFYSGNIFLKNVGRFIKVAVGDYSLQFGQGLSLWSGQGIGKGADVGSAAKQDIGLRPYSSSNESLFFRGIATTVKFGNFLYSPFLSYNKLDGNLSLSALNRPEIASIAIGGLHRTPVERQNKNSATQVVFGNALQYEGQNLDIGMTVYHTEFSNPFQKGRLLYNQFDFASKKLTNAGAHYSYTFKNNYLFGEAAQSLGSGFAFINGLLTSLSPQVSVILLYRNYSRNYHCFFNQAFSEGTAAVNEKGFYSGFVIKPAPKLELTCYMDAFFFPWMKFRADAPSNGYEISSQFVYSFSKRMRLTAKYRYQLKQENDEAQETVNTLEDVKRQNLRLDLNYKLGENFTVRNRAEVSYYKKGIGQTENGYMMYQDVIYNPLQSKLSGNLRFAIFDTRNFDTRIYAFENDVLFSYSSPAYQNSGIRYYINARYTLKRGVDLWCKYSITNYANLEEIGSGLDLIEGNKKSEIKVQLRCQF